MCKSLSFLRESTLAKAILAIALLTLGGGESLTLNAKEPANWLFGFGIGAGTSRIDEKYPESAKNGFGLNELPPPYNQLANRARSADSSTQGWGVNWELLVGYKHFLNDWVGFRYYANVGAQHYKHDIFTAGKVQAGVIEYTANADLLLNFYDSPNFTFGILGGFGVGGAYFDSPALKTYEQQWSYGNAPFTNATIHQDLGKIQKNHLSANLSVGMRFNIFQKIREVGKRVCSQGGDGRRTCKVPISYLEHSIEFNAKFPMITYRATDSGDIVSYYIRQTNIQTGQQQDFLLGYANRPGYEVKNPYKLTLRYIFAF